jgi:hypothetical protein
MSLFHWDYLFFSLTLPPRGDSTLLTEALMKDEWLTLDLKDKQRYSPFNWVPPDLSVPISQNSIF